MRALAREADVETRYGGRFVQSVNGLDGQPRRPAGLVLVRERLRGRSQRGLVPAARRRRGVVRLPLLGARGRGSRRRRRLPGAVPARVRRAPSARGGPVRAGLRRSGRARSAPRSAPTRSSRSEPPVPDGANVLEVAGGSAARTAELARRDGRRPGPVRRSAATVDLDAQVRRSREPRARQPLLLAAAGTAALLADRLWAVATIAAVLLAVCLRAPVGPPPRLPLRRALDRARRASCSRRSSGRARTGRSSGRGRRCPCSARST